MSRINKIILEKVNAFLYKRDVLNAIDKQRNVIVLLH